MSPYRLKHRRTAATCLTVGILALAGCGSADKHAEAEGGAAATSTATIPASASSVPAETEPSPSAASNPARTAARPATPASPTSRRPTAPHFSSTSPGTGGNPPAGTPWQWSPNTPPSCTPKTTAKPGAFIQSILVRPPVENSTAWNGWSGEDNACFAYAVGVTDPNAKSIQLLVMDTKTRDQKAFTGHIGDVVSVGRFTIKITPSSGIYGPTLFEAGFYWT
jgi:hypothetical protein